MPYQPNTSADRQAMLQAIGAASVEELFSCIPANMQLNRPLNLPPALGEMELTQHLGKLSSQNLAAGQGLCFLGGGAYDHFVPAVVDALASRGEFYTSYTPYQPEVSQGNLQAMFEYQTMVCQLTGLDVSNASLYDGGSAAVEAVLMAINATRRDKVVTFDSVHPEYRQTLETYFGCLDCELITLPAPGAADMQSLAAAVDEKTACVLIQHPNFFGNLEDVAAAAEIAHQAGALLVQSFDPISLGLLKRPGDLGADIAVAEGQSLGTPLLYGGPYLGMMACREKFVRRLPGRIAGETVDRHGKRCWTLTLQTREQHIRREKATSNICTNQGLLALRAAIYLSVVGPQGLKETAELCLQRSRYAMEKLCQTGRFEPAFPQQTSFKEFVIRDRQGQVETLLKDAVQEGFLAGLSLEDWYPQHKDCLLVAVTEKRTYEEIDALAKALSP